MILDELGEFLDATALSTAATGLALVGDVIDLQQARDIGQGRPVYWVTQVDTAPTSGGAATVEFQLVSDAQAAIAVDGTATVHAKTGSFAIASLPAGKQFAIALPLEDPAYERFLGVLQNVGTAALTAGKVNSFLTLDVGKWKAYPDAI